MQPCASFVVHTAVKTKSMKRLVLWVCASLFLAFVSIVGLFTLRWAWKYYGLPELPDRQENETIEERAEHALAFARRRRLARLDRSNNQGY